MGGKVRDITMAKNDTKVSGKSVATLAAVGGEQKVALSLVFSDWKRNPRKESDEQADKELVEDMRLHGMISPLTVVVQDGPKGTKYRVAAGYRRFNAAGIAGLKEIPIVVREFATPEAEFNFAVSENEKRSDLTVWDRIALVGKLADSGKNVNDISAHLRGGGIKGLDGKDGLATSTVYRYKQMAEGLDSQVFEELRRMSRGGDGKAPYRFAETLIGSRKKDMTVEGVGGKRVPNATEQRKALEDWKKELATKASEAAAKGEAEASGETSEGAKGEAEKRVRFHMKAAEVMALMQKCAKAAARLPKSDEAGKARFLGMSSILDVVLGLQDVAILGLPSDEVLNKSTNGKLERSTVPR
jgi:ParB/RepB/Spo0J family partition protein